MAESRLQLKSVLAALSINPHINEPTVFTFYRFSLFLKDPLFQLICYFPHISLNYATNDCHFEGFFFDQ